MNKLLLTGFEPFLEFPINPTADIVNELNGTVLNEHEIIGEILSVDFHKSGKQLIDLIHKHNPETVISLGLAGGRKCITPERIAINCNDGPVDNNGNKPRGEKIIDNGPDGYFSTLPIHEMVDKLKVAGLPAEISDTAGTYLCNNVMYHGLHYFKNKQLNQKSGFIHIPASHALAIRKNLPSWSLDDLVRAIKISIQCL
ncbi:pyroglutamyl-peptidase I [Virgibacillus oceani]|uniref:Pyroglutamyl-peptidase I n=1 Tax=Virgibacillus oceani TaxID=1479511 RepID=A0A917H5B4_9BACI|nr:pyroglutamyl-peptidase I [Virgibacillus oceani]GGG67602.1 pyrrolidone-carboxylate peptidase [Virgibacillus oceani]